MQLAHQHGLEVLQVEGYLAGICAGMAVSQEHLLCVHCQLRVQGLVRMPCIAGLQVAAPLGTTAPTHMEILSTLVTCTRVRSVWSAAVVADRKFWVCTHHNSGVQYCTDGAS